MNITRYFQFKTAAINSAFAITSTVNLHNTDRRGTMQQCPVPADNMGIAFHQPLTLSLTAKGCFLGMLQLRLMAPTNLHTGGMPKADAPHPPNCSQGSKSWMVRSMFCAQNLGWKKSGVGQISLTSFEIQPARLGSPRSWANLQASQGRKICSWCSQPPAHPGWKVLPEMLQSVSIWIVWADKHFQVPEFRLPGRLDLGAAPLYLHALSHTYILCLWRKHLL